MKIRLNQFNLVNVFVWGKQSTCKANLTKCINYATYNIWNRMIERNDQQAQQFCNYCKFTETIPDLSEGDNITKWYKLEVAKRRLLYLLDARSLPYSFKI